MSFLTTLGKGLSDLGKGAVHAVTHPVETLTAPERATVHGVAAITGAIDPKAGQTLAQGANALDQAASATDTFVDPVGVALEPKIDHGIDTATTSLTRGAEAEFRAAVNAADQEFDSIKATLEEALKRGEAEVAKAIAKTKVQALAEDMNSLVAEMNRLENDLAHDISALKAAALHRVVTPQARLALLSVANALQNVIAPFHTQSFASFGIDFGASAALGIEGDVSIGLLAGFPNITDVRGYGAVGVSVGAAEGIEGDVSLVFTTSAPAESGGPGLDIIISGDFGVGGTVVVSFNLPDLSFGGISIGLAAGEEVDISVGAGYTFVF